MKKIQNTAFTLIELLVVIAIIGILAGVVIASLNGARNKAADAAVKSNLTNARSQAEIYYDAFGSYGSVGGGVYYQGDCLTNSSVFRDITYTSLSAPVTAAIESAHQASGSVAKQCRLSVDRQDYAIFVRLKTSTAYWCIDGTGASKEVSALPSGSVAKCS